MVELNNAFFGIGAVQGGSWNNVVPFSGSVPHRAVYNNSMLYPHLDAEQALMSIIKEVRKINTM